MEEDVIIDFSKVPKRVITLKCKNMSIMHEPTELEQIQEINRYEEAKKKEFKGEIWTDCATKSHLIGSGEYLNLTAEDLQYANVNSTNVNHPKHYNNYSVEVIDMMEKIYGTEKLMIFCELNAFKYRMRAGTKNSLEEDLAKEKWYLDKVKELKDKL